MSIITIKNFKNPTDEKFKTIRDSFIDYNKKNRLITKFLDKDEKKIAEKQDNLFQNANKLTNLVEENSLECYSNEIKRKKSSYFTKVFLLLILFLISSQCINEDNLIIISLIKKKDDNSSFFKIIFLLFLSLAYLIALLVQKYFLKNIFFKKSSKIILLFLFSFSIILKISVFAFLHLNSKDTDENKMIIFIVLVFSTFVLIIISEFLMIVIINLFIGLLPSNKFKFLCFKQSKIINVIDKLSRLLPGMFFLVINIIEHEYELLYLPSLEIIFIFLSICFCLCKGNLLKTHSLTRILYNNNN
jgi:hypothetical protein